MFKTMDTYFEEMPVEMLLLTVTSGKRYHL
jgi:hypothetical protein